MKTQPLRKKWTEIAQFFAFKKVDGNCPVFSLTLNTSRPQNESAPRQPHHFFIPSYHLTHIIKL